VEDNMRRLVLALGALVLLVGCTSMIHMQHPDGRRATCGDTWAYGVRAFTAGEQDRGCVADYQRQGYERVPN
jgi:uncharacterized protein YceK